MRVKEHIEAGTECPAGRSARDRHRSDVVAEVARVERDKHIEEAAADEHLVSALEGQRYNLNRYRSATDRRICLTLNDRVGVKGSGRIPDESNVANRPAKVEVSARYCLEIVGPKRHARCSWL